MCLVPRDAVIDQKSRACATAFAGKARLAFQPREQYYQSGEESRVSRAEGKEAAD